MEINDECYCDFEAPKSLLKRARQFIADSGCDEDDSDVNLERNQLLAEIDAALS